MTAPNMAAITASLERSLQNCSLNHHQPTRGGGGGRIEREGSSSTSDADAPENHHPQNTAAAGDDDATLELNSHISLPYHWEQCLDLKTGEIYYINWRNGMRATEDPRTAASPEYSGGDYYYYSEDDSSYDSEESSSESSPCLSREQQYYNSDSNTTTHNHHRTDQKENVLVVAGCKSCLMYFMVPKQVGDCPKCTGQLLHFDRSDDGSS